MEEVNVVKTCKKCATAFRGRDCPPCKKVAAAAYRAKNKEKIKSYDAAYRKSQMVDGVNLYGAAYRAANPEKFKAYSKNRSPRGSYDGPRRTRRKSTNDPVEIAKRVEEVRIQKAQYSRDNYEKNREYSAEYRNKNSEKLKIYAIKWRKNNPDLVARISNNRRGRMIGADGVISKGLSTKLFELQKGRCACCGAPLGKKYHLDHIHPLARGGSNHDSNFQLLTPLCNSQKGAKNPIDFMRSRGFLL